ncbi:hypothetical protein DM02DRAFT_85809 [Periconia macrospinosa]|uniref:Uncharacterized protein n=1 Tax=Periconia macrospinosa TaxID=97972 RepID=A0A2V1DH01_9PLEO|nr:hypothetical protein DM02DRAFT_85809 [Periconia macrospinosa]
MEMEQINRKRHHRSPQGPKRLCKAAEGQRDRGPIDKPLHDSIASCFPCGYHAQPLYIPFRAPSLGFPYHAQEPFFVRTRTTTIPNRLLGTCCAAPWVGQPPGACASARPCGIFFYILVFFWTSKRATCTSTDSPIFRIVQCQQSKRSIDACLKFNDKNPRLWSRNRETNPSW